MGIETCFLTFFEEFNVATGATSDSFHERLWLRLDQRFQFRPDETFGFLVLFIPICLLLCQFFNQLGLERTLRGAHRLQRPKPTAVLSFVANKSEMDEIHSHEFLF